MGGKELGVDRVPFPSDTNEAEGHSGPQAEMKSAVPRGGHRPCPKRREQQQEQQQSPANGRVTHPVSFLLGRGLGEGRRGRETRH